MIRNMLSRCQLALAASLLVVLSTCGWAQQVARPHVAQGRGGAVASVCPWATRTGVQVLREGGNAVDAAVAVAFTLAVTWPEAGNIGGGGFMLVLPGPGQPVWCVDYRETAPAAAKVDMYPLGEKTLGARYVGVPGTVAGLHLAHCRYGRLPWRRLLRDAIELAERGFPVSDALARSLNRVLQDPDSKPFAGLRRTFGHPQGRPWRKGDLLRQPELARTLRLLAREGPKAFYQGEIARLIVRQMQASGGLITAEDLARYRAKLRVAVQGQYRGYTIYGAPPPSSGGICTVLAMNQLERFELRSLGPWSAQTWHLVAEAMRRSFLDRARHLGDPDFVTIPRFLTSKSYAARLARSIDPRQATPSRELAPDLPIVEEGTQTTHFSVVDGRGMAVSNTYTLEMSYGSRVVVRGAGFLLNNEMGDFNRKAGHTDTRGNIGTAANLPAPGKRMLSSQSPTLVTRNGRVVLVLGSPGGRTIINTVVCLLVRTLELGQPLPEAVAAPRIHHQWLPDRVMAERCDDPRWPKVIEGLRHRGHQVVFHRGTQGDAHCVLVDPATGRMTAVADARRQGAAAVVEPAGGGKTDSRAGEPHDRAE